jgi:GntR family transcriptional repressor for pyruvate dehydrogenase complex
MMTIPRNTGTLSDSIASQLGNRILSGDLPAWSKLPSESELGDRLGVSRTAIRDAMRTLSAQGLVEIRHGHGMVVASPSDGPFADALVMMLLRSNLTVGDVLEARAAIDAGVCPVAATRGNAADWDRLASDLNVFAVSIEKAEWEAAHEAHNAFHLGLLAATHLPAGEIMLRPLQHLVLLTSFPPRSETELWELSAHQLILDALRRGDEAATRQALLDHYRVMETESYAQLRATTFRDSPGVGRAMELTRYAQGISARPNGDRPKPARPRRKRSVAGETG